MGDSYFSGLYLKNLCKDADCVVTTIGNGSTEVFRLFGIHNICILSQEDTNCLIAFCQFMQICEKEVTILHYQALEEYSGISWKFNGIRGLCFADLIESLVFPNLNIKDRKYPKFDEEDEQFLRKYGIKKNCSIILFPYSNTLFSPQENFWEQIVKTYGSKYRMYTYINGEQMPIKNTLSISTNISKVNSLVEYAGMYIGIRSGMMDILSRAKCRKIVLYPSYGAEGWIKGRIIDFWSLKNFRYANDIEEYEWDKSFSIKL